MPGWHEATRRLQEEGRFQMMGIVQEQHPHRTRLFMQWKRMDWPIMVDSLDLLDVSVVPLTLLIDEFGVVRKVRARPTDLASFLDTRYSPPDSQPRPPSPPDLDLLKTGAASGRFEDLMALGQGAFVWGSRPTALSEAIEVLEKVIASHPKAGSAHFRLGVAYRARYDSSQRRESDFARAVEEWGRALELDPNQYIWRRRIQQYGPRLDKPYPFYDWVPQARKEIEARGETPQPLVVEPGGAEFARPLRQFVAASEAAGPPDSQGRIRRDLEKLVDADVVLVPARIGAGESARIHVILRPNLSRQAHWNNEAEDLLFWVDAPSGWTLDRHLIKIPRPPEIVSVETRRIEFEVQSPESGHDGAVLQAYALYYVCEDVDGACLYRRRDFTIKIPSKLP